MRNEIVLWIKKICKKYQLSANFIFDGDIWVIHKDGFAVQNFTTEQFFQIPKRARENMYGPLVRIGLANNLGANHKDQMVIPHRFGHKIV